MFRKLHIQMTLFSTFVTSTILVLMTLACLFISERGTKLNSYATFSNNVSSCITYLEGQNLISHSWILNAENDYGIKMEIRDNGNSLFFFKLQPKDDFDSVFLNAARISVETFGLNVDASGQKPKLTKSAVFKMKGYYAGTVVIPKQDSVLSAVFLCPLDRLNRQLVSQRLIFAAMVAIAIAALGIFSWFFTRRMIRPLEESRRRQTEFIASASHELRSPLAVILSSIQAMKNASTEETRQFRLTIQNEGERMSRLIGDMLSLANADNQSWSIHPAPCELDTLLLDAYEKYETLFAHKKLTLSIMLPDTPLAACVCDSSRIFQVLSILLDNAMSYVPERGTVSLSLEENEHDFIICVSDNGPGIPESDREAVFQRFYRADSARNDKQHFGLGLCIAREIISLHHGQIRAEEASGGGAAFHITLPK